MGKRLLILVSMLLLSAMIVAGFGIFLKYEILVPAGIFQDKSIFEVPFAAMKDPVAQFVIQKAKNQEEQADPQPTAAQNVSSNTQPTEIAPQEETLPVQKQPEEITESWFDDALFVGDSRTVGLRDYARLGKADYFCSVGMTVFDATTQRLSDQNFAETDLRSLLQSKRYNKIYVSLGLNEAGEPYQLIIEAYNELIKMIRKEQPHAVIILQGLITVGREKAASKWYFSVENIQNINAGIRDFANGTTIHYIDANEHFADEEGSMPEGRTFDGCHFYIAGYEEWAQWILDNAKTLNISFG